MVASGGTWDVRRAELRQTEGFPFIGEVDRLVGTILVRCDGRRTLGEVVAEVAEHMQTDPEQTARSAAAVIRRLMLSGFLTAAPAGGGMKHGMNHGIPGIPRHHGLTRRLCSGRV